MSFSKITLSLIASACAVTAVSAMEFQVLGAKAASMGGAGVATSPSSLSAYNNPALLAKNKEKFSLHIGAGVGLKDTGAGKAVGDLSDLKFSDTMDKLDGNAQSVTQTDIDTLKKARDIVTGMDKKGFSLNPTADFGLSYKSFGTGLFITSDIGGVANVDQTRTALIFETSTPGQYIDIETFNPNSPVYLTQAQYQAASLKAAADSGTTNIDVIGLAVAEVPLAYGYAFETPYGSLSVGGAAKVMAGKTFYTQVKVDSTNAFDNADKNVVNTTTFGVDLGLAYQPSFSESLNLALVGKNLNKPSFNVQGGGKYEIKPAYRAGAAYKVGKRLELAFDADLTENKGLTGYNTRYVGGGANIDLTLLELNLGLMKNTAANDLAGLIYTAGIATGPSWLHFELSGQMASKSGAVDGTAYPMQALVNFALSSAW
ncbi:MAG: conjugal transfer protein TraF [Sulfuricurvum sp.]|jgi:hypothetical protein|uniref:conjugal transfer protein TraF n=1 Tax=Sulfuricurvum sp. TaxID=2025608 RepID=UPI0025D130A6|nr:conjugal transfer protein TraF [Sulfuricurvum sp.]MCK9372005.1 conjugal transfer protein TraF [Sulfuricurvum sp.]